MSFYSQYIGFNGSLYLPLAGGTMTGSIQVNPDNAIDLGASSGRWRSVYTYDLQMRDTLNATPSGTTVNFSIQAQPTLATNGYTWQLIGGQGGAASAAAAGGNGGLTTIQAGNGGNGTAGRAAGNGGTLSLNAGNPGTNNGGGAGTIGIINIGTNGAPQINIGIGGTTTVVGGTLRYDNTNGAATPGATVCNAWDGFLIVNVAGVLKRVPYTSP